MTSRSYFFKIITFILAALLTLYLGYQAYRFLAEPVKLADALLVTVDDSISAQGYFFRDETVIEGLSQGVPVLAVKPGEKVAKDALLAVYYRDETARSDSLLLDGLNRQIEDYKYVLEEAENKPDTTFLDRGIVTAVLSVNGMAEDGILSKAEDKISSIKSLVLRRNLIYGDVSGVEEKIGSLTKQRDALADRLSGGFTPLATPVSGYFTPHADGYEEVLTLDAAKKFTVSDYDAIGLKRQPVSGTAAGRVAGSFRWYFAVCLPEGQAARLSRGASVRLQFSQILEDDVWVTVSRIAKGGDGRALVVFSGTAVNEELLAARSQPVEIVLARYKGIKVPKAALRQVDGDWGVYCLSGQRAIFKKIEPVFETDSYFVVRSEGLTPGEVFIHDEIIVSGKGIRNRQVVQ